MHRAQRLWLALVVSGLLQAAADNLPAQPMYTLQITASGKDSLLLEDFSYKTRFADTLSRRRELADLLHRLHESGYLEATWQPLQADSLHVQLQLTVGPRWYWVQLRRGNADPLLLRRAGFRESDFAGRPVSVQRLNQLFNQLISYCENHGYPFAEVRLDSLQADASALRAVLKLNPGRRIFLDSIRVQGNARLANSFLQGYLNLRLPAAYNEALIRQAVPRLQQLPFVSLTGTPMVTFSADRAGLTLPLNRRNASRFHFILGLLPNALPGGRLLLTGEGDLDLKNAFGAGEQLRFTFSRLNTRTAQALLKAEYPYPLQLPFATDGSFFLLRNDSLYVDVRFRGGVKYFLDASRHARFYYGRNTTSIISFDSLQVVQTKRLPSYLDSREHLLGAELLLRSERFLPGNMRGWSLQLTGEVGNRSFRSNPSILQLKDPEQPDFDFASLYDSLPGQQVKWSLQGQAEGFLPITNRQVLRLAYAGAVLYAPHYLLSDLYRIGGFERLRGFDELSIFVSMYQLLSAEYRLLLAGRSYAYLFFDAAYTENRLQRPSQHDWPLGFGAGMSFDTKNGVFVINYALGRQQGNPIQVRSAKIHFGYINYF